MITDEELLKKIDSAMADYHGQIDDFYSAVGVIVVGRLMGWRAMRLMSQRRHWSLASTIFGDLKEIMPQKGSYYDKSIAMAIVDKIGGYWDYVRGSKQLSDLKDRKLIGN